MAEEKSTKADQMVKVLQRIETGFQEGLSDEELAKELKMAESRISMLRQSMGLTYKATINVFEKSRKVAWEEAKENYMIPHFGIPPEVAKKLGLKDDFDYEFFASVIKPKVLQITILEREE